MASSPTHSQRSSFDLSGAAQRASFDMSPPAAEQHLQQDGAGPGPPPAGAGLPRRSLDNPQTVSGAASVAAELRRASVDSPGGMRGPGGGKGDRPSADEPAPLRILIAEDNKARAVAVSMSPMHGDLQHHQG